MRFVVVLLMLVFDFLTSTVSAHEVIFNDEVLLAGGAQSPKTAIGADLDGDGDNDIVSALGGSSDMVAWFENLDGEGTFSAQQVIGTHDGASSMFCIDLDGDGDLDIISASWSEENIVWYENIDGEGTYGVQHTITESASSIQHVHGADLDGDGDNDVLSACEFVDAIFWYENIDGLGNFGPAQGITNEAEQAHWVSTADLDGDGDIDVLSASAGDDKIAWYENIDGLGDFGDQQVIDSEADGTQCVERADFDGDGDIDVVAPIRHDDKIVWYENLDGLGGFGAQQVITLETDGIRFVSTADVDGDGDIDVLGASVSDNKITWYENTDGLGDFGPQIIITTDVIEPQSVYCSDLDGDGDNDVITTSRIDDKIAWHENTDGLGDFGEQQILTTNANYAMSVFSTDLDGDGDYDVLSASRGDSKIAWYENIDGNGNFGLQQIISSDAEGAWCVFSADLDGDGDNDVLSASRDACMIAWYENTDGFGSFNAAHEIYIGELEAYCVYAIDLDGDFDLDVISGTSGEVTWYENTDGAGNFGPPQTITIAANNVFSVFSVDLDGDGDNDVLSASNYTYGVAWYENIDGLGDFSADRVVITDDILEPQSVYSVDLDGDGDYDVLAASRLDNMITWYENTDGLGTFSPQPVITTNAMDARSVFSIDLDNDGDNDVISGAEDGQGVAWYENLDGLGNFGPQQYITTHDMGAWCVFAADLDGEGSNDVLFTRLLADQVGWYRQVPPGSAPDNFDLLQPDNESYVYPEEVVLEWEETTDPDNDFTYYRVFVSDDPDDLEDGYILSTSNTNYTFTGEVGVQYWWSIMARDDRVNDTWANQPFSFTIDLNPLGETPTDKLPTQYELTSVHPNPFNPTTSITIGLPDQAHLRLNIYNILGQSVKVLANRRLTAGYHNFTFDGSRLPSGIYIIQAYVADNMNETRKVILMK